jgi:predicted RNA-binding Zn-ribbon protein involved in translation (DUF1610 family)
VGIAIFFLLAVLAAGVIIYPLFPGRMPAEPVPAVADGDIEQAVRKLRQSRNRTGLLCPHCGKGYQAGDRFCVGCGGALPRAEASVTGPTCPECGAVIRRDDQFCAKCGHRMGAGEAT